MAVAVPTAAWAVPSETPQAGTPGFNGRVATMVRVGNTIYLGGEFTQAGGQTRNRLAAVNATTGTLLPWNPNASAVVSTLIVGPDGFIYAGGKFGNVGGQNRKNVAKINASTGAVVGGWNPRATGGEVLALAAGNGQIYVGGNFSTLGGAARSKIGSVDPVTGAVSAWDPGATGTDHFGRLLELQVAADGSVYAGGFFNFIGGLSRTYVAKLDPVTGLADPAFNANIASFGRVNRIAFQSGNVFISGGGRAPQLSSLNPATGAANWRVLGSGDMNALALSSTALYSGGHYNFIGGGRTCTAATCTFRRKLAAFDPATGALLDWAPPVQTGDINGDDAGVWVVTVSDSAVNIGGGFVSVNNQPRDSFARFLGTP